MLSNYAIYAGVLFSSDINTQSTGTCYMFQLQSKVRFKRTKNIFKNIISHNALEE